MADYGHPITSDEALQIMRQALAGGEVAFRGDQQTVG